MKIKYNVLLFLIFIIVFIKIFILIYHNLYFHILPYGSDASMYHSFAQSGQMEGINLWMDWLALLNSKGLYERLYLTVIIQFFSVFFIPYFFMVLVKRLVKSRYHATAGFFILSCYASLYLYSGDIYRDVIMLFLFLVSIYIANISMTKSNLSSFVFLLFFMIMSYVLFRLRPYLGISILLAYITSQIYLSKNLKTDVLVYFIVVIVVSASGLLNPLYEYRTGFESAGGGSTLNIDLKNANVVTILPLFIWSYLGQFFGLYIVNFTALVIFFAESIPIIYFIKNTKFENLNVRFFRFLLYFVVIYNTVWVLANDNLGTASRLRMFSYVIIILMFLISKAYDNHKKFN